MGGYGMVHNLTSKHDAGNARRSFLLVYCYNSKMLMVQPVGENTTPERNTQLVRMRTISCEKRPYVNSMEHHSVDEWYGQGS